jgi:hypothetical protein
MYTLRQPTGPIAIDEYQEDPEEQAKRLEEEEEFKVSINAPVKEKKDLNCWDYTLRKYRHESIVEYISHC